MSGLDQNGIRTEKRDMKEKRKSDNLIKKMMNWMLQEKGLAAFLIITACLMLGSIGYIISKYSMHPRYILTGSDIMLICRR